MRLNIVILAALMMVLTPQWGVAQEVAVTPLSGAASSTVSGGLQLGRLLRDSNAELPQYSCDLRKQFSQCRQYVVGPGNAEIRVKELSDACQALEGILTQSPCPQDQVIAQCKEVKFRRDAVYDASYYQGPSSIWSVEKVQEVCRHLPGQFVALDR